MASDTIDETEWMSSELIIINQIQEACRDLLQQNFPHIKRAMIQSDDSKARVSLSAEITDLGNRNYNIKTKFAVGIRFADEREDIVNGAQVEMSFS